MAILSHQRALCVLLPITGEPIRPSLAGYILVIVTKKVASLRVAALQDRYYLSTTCDSKEIIAGLSIQTATARAHPSFGPELTEATIFPFLIVHTIISFSSRPCSGSIARTDGQQDA